MSALLLVENVELHEGLRVGVVLALKKLAERLGIRKALANTHKGKLALRQIMAPVCLTQCLNAKVVVAEVVIIFAESGFDLYPVVACNGKQRRNDPGVSPRI